MRCREDLRRARQNARHRVAKQLLRQGLVYREGQRSWTRRHQAWLARQRLADPLAQRALEHMRAHLEGLDAQLAALERELDEIARRAPWAQAVGWLCCFRGVASGTALGLLAEHARRLVVEAAWHYRHPPARGARLQAAYAAAPPACGARALAAQVRLYHRHRSLTQHGKRSTVVNVALARELVGFIWAAMTDQPLREEALAA